MLWRIIDRSLHWSNAAWHCFTSWTGFTTGAYRKTSHLPAAQSLTTIPSSSKIWSKCINQQRLFWSLCKYNFMGMKGQHAAVNISRLNCCQTRSVNHKCARWAEGYAQHAPSLAGISPPITHHGTPHLLRLISSITHMFPRKSILAIHQSLPRCDGTGFC